MLPVLFWNADLKENEKVYVDMPMGFAQYGKNKKEDVPQVEEDSLWAPSESKSLLEVHYSQAPRVWIGTIEV
jgi:hypothetical protein